MKHRIYLDGNNRKLLLEIIEHFMLWNSSRCVIESGILMDERRLAPDLERLINSLGFYELKPKDLYIGKA